MRRLLFAALAIGCVHTLQLVPAGQTSSSAAGVEVQAGAKQWSGSPPDLPALLTPLYVTVRNQGDQPIRLRYRDLSLEAGGMQATALPPFKLQRPGSPTSTVEVFPSENFFLYSPYAQFYPAAPSRRRSRRGPPNS
jgi:hypothetical protein